jgi:hypothetical protein
MFEASLADAERALGPDHPLTKTVHTNLKITSGNN